MSPRHIIYALSIVKFCTMFVIVATKDENTTKREAGFGPFLKNNNTDFKNGHKIFLLGVCRGIILPGIQRKGFGLDKCQLFPK